MRVSCFEACSWSGCGRHGVVRVLLMLFALRLASLVRGYCLRVADRHGTGGISGDCPRRSVGGY